jgi:hypothetical protein
MKILDIYQDPEYEKERVLQFRFYNEKDQDGFFRRGWGPWRDVPEHFEGK